MVALVVTPLRASTIHAVPLFDQRLFVHPDQPATWPVEVQDDVENQREEQILDRPEVVGGPLHLAQRVPGECARGDETSTEQQDDRRRHVVAH